MAFFCASRHTRLPYEPSLGAPCVALTRGALKTQCSSRNTPISPSLSRPNIPTPDTPLHQPTWGSLQHTYSSSGKAEPVPPSRSSTADSFRVYRHGNRLDAADNSWVESSATPYDTPLSYGGWLQARTLGAKIASIITDAEAEYQASTSQDSDSTTGAEYTSDLDSKKLRRKRRRFKVALHSSPFLRCIQTSVGISAGLCEPPGTPPPYPRINRANSLATSQVTRPVLRRPTASPVLPPIGSEPLMSPLDLKDLTFAHRLFPKLVLRLDPFLGEWMSPDYFEKIAPPPSTSAMLGQAKAELLRREDYTKYTDPGLQAGAAGAQGTSSSNTQAAASSGGESPLDTVPDMASALPGAAKPKAGYIAPMPHYAISNNMQIPEGYVAHARDACLTVDYQWDSSRAPQGWGEGGAYGEEWTAMHKRFRNGVQRLVEWYAGCDNPTDMDWRVAPPGTNGAANGHHRKKWAEEQQSGDDDEDDDEEEEESVVILVSHGAGCNALIGAITHQPALMDVGVASITLAVRKPTAEALRVGVECPPVHRLYDLKMTANSDHLRGVTTSSPSPTPRNHGLRGRAPSSAGVLAPFTYADAYRRTSAGASFGKNGPKAPSGLSVEASSSSSSSSAVAPATTNSSTAATAPPAPVRQTSFGLWSPVRREEEVDDDDDFFPDFDNKRFESPVDAPRDDFYGAGLVAQSSGLALPDFGTGQGEGPGGLWSGNKGD